MRKAVRLDRVEPALSALPIKESMRYPMNMPESIESMIKMTDLALDKCIYNFPDSAHVVLNVAPFPFATGAMRAAYYAMLSDSRPRLAKESIYASKSYLTEEKYEATLQCRRAAKYLSTESKTRKRKTSSCPTGDFLIIIILMVVFCNSWLLVIKSSWS